MTNVKTKRYCVAWADAEKKYHRSIVEGCFKNKSDATRTILEEDNRRIILAVRPIKTR